MDYGVELPHKLYKALGDHIVFPIENEEGATTRQLLENMPSPSTRGKFKPASPHVYLKLSRTLTLYMLQSLVQGITQFLKPVAMQMSTLVYFQLHKSTFFQAYINQAIKKLQGESETPTPVVTISLFGRALYNTTVLLQRLVKGTATYAEIAADNSLNLNEVDVEAEFSILVKCKSIGIHSTFGLNGIKSIFKLIQCSGYILKIEEVCQQYNLVGCLEDQQLKLLVGLATELQNEEEKAKLTPAAAISKWKQVCASLCLRENESMKSLELFQAVADSVDFYHFLKEKQFLGSRGEALFIQEFELLTAHLQHEEYNEALLNHLYAAFRFISPFMDSAQTFQKLMTAVATFDTTAGLNQLVTVKKNMHLIRLWFSRAEVSIL